MEKVSLSRVNQFVLKKQHLADESKIEDIVQIAKDIGGLHGTSATGPYLSLFARSNSFRRDNLSFEMSKKKSLSRIRYVRNTVYILPKQFIPVAYAATSQKAEVTSERFSKSLGITPTQYTRMANKILKILKGRGLTTREIKKKLWISTNIGPVVNLMCDRGLLMRSLPREGWKSTQYAYYLFKDYYPDLNLSAYGEEDAREMVVEQYLLSFGPVTEQDIVWWTGFTKTQVREILKGLGGKVSSIAIPELTGGFFVHSSQLESLKSVDAPKSPVINILPALDPYLMGYKDRERYCYPRHLKMIFDRSGNATSTILVDGRVVGIWDFDEPLVKMYLFADMERAVCDSILSIAGDVGMFIADKPVRVKVCDSMVPLPQRTAGSFMSPLKNC